MRSTFLAAALLAVAVALAAPPERGAPLARKGALGVQFAALTEADAKASGLKVGDGLKVVRVLPGLTAEKVGLKEGDVVLRLAGKPLPNPAAVAPAARTLEGGKPVELRVRRRTENLVLTGETVPRPKQKADGFEVVYDQVVSRGRRIRVIATHPTAAGPHPTVFLIGGIGAYSVDGDFASTAYGTILGPLAKSGYATVRIDKPGQGDSDGPLYPELRFGDEMDAYLQALRLAKTLPFVDRNRIAIFGHSMGGTFGPLVAAQEPVRGLVVGGTVSKTWVEYWLENTRRQSLLGGQDPATLDQSMRNLASLSELLFGQGLSPAQIERRRRDLAPLMRAVSPDGRTMSGVGIPFFQELAKQNLPAAWKVVDARVLAFWGENEFISAEWDHQYIVDMVNARRPGTATYQRVPQSDHGFFKTTSTRDSFAKWGRPGNEFNPNIVEIVRTWLDANVR